MVPRIDIFILSHNRQDYILESIASILQQTFLGYNLYVLDNCSTDNTVNVVKVPMFDHGPVAQARAKHPVTGYSMESYRMIFVDQSNYDGQANVQMINKKGREMMRWAVAGSVVPRGFSGSDTRASDIDGASVHMLKTAGIVLKRFDTSLDLQCVAS